MPNSIQPLLRSLSLREWVKLFGTRFDKKLHRRVRWKPWPKQLELCDFLDENKEGSIPKARQLGVSNLAGEEIAKEALQNDGVLCMVFSKTDTDAMEYMETNVKQRIKGLPRIRGIRWPRIERESLRAVKLSNGSRIVSFPSSNRSGASFVADYVLFDEAGGIDLQPGVSLAAMYRNVSPTLEKADGKLRMMGTSEPGSYYNSMVSEILAGTKPIPQFFLPADADPARTKKWFENTLAKFPSVIDFRTQYPMGIEDFLSVREGLVFPQFREAIHVSETEAPSRSLFFMGYDHGYRHPAVLLEIWHDSLSDVVFVRREHYWYETQAELIADEIKTTIDERGRLPHKMIADSAIWGETGIPGVIDVFKRKGLTMFIKSIKHRAKFGMDASTGEISRRLTEGGLLIHPECRNLIAEFKGWTWDKNLRGEHPVDKNNDGIDALRYVLAEIGIRTIIDPATDEPREFGNALDGNPVEDDFGWLGL